MKGGKRPGAGRKRKVEEHRIRDMVLSAAETEFGSKEGLFTELAKLAKTAKRDSDKISAISKLLEYAYGKAPQSINLDADVQTSIKLDKDVRNLAGLSTRSTTEDSKE